MAAISKPNIVIKLYTKNSYLQPHFTPEYYTPFIVHIEGLFHTPKSPKQVDS